MNSNTPNLPFIRTRNLVLRLLAAAGGTATAAELSAREPRLKTTMVMAAGKPYAAAQAITSRVLLVLAAQGKIVRGRPIGTWLSQQYRWVLAEHWLREEAGVIGEAGDIGAAAVVGAAGEAAARAELARQWLGAYGPAPLADLKWWTGWTMANVRQAAAAIGAVEVELDDRAGWLLPDDLDPSGDLGDWAALLPALAGVDGVIVRSATTIDAEALSHAPSLRVVARAGVGLDNVDVDAATKAGVMVVNAPSSNVVSAAEHAVGLLLAVARNVPQAMASLKAGEWTRAKFTGAALYQKVAGILGLGRIGVLVNNAAVVEDAPALEMTEKQWDSVLAVNLKGAFLCSQIAARQMLRQEEGGVIVNIGASTGIRGRRDGVNTCASKAGLMIMTQCLALELAPKVRVNTVIPGLTVTGETARRFGLSDHAVRQARVQAVPLGRLGEPDDVAGAVMLLLAGDARFITGQKIVINGGQNMS